ncbi:uncharacterized protein LOC126252157 [Schistocerca nitens]|uniref:uncharacterized protein LOC126252157 n=1 Tax=Schistocerca nitens TaxID=7011 RepID=UPI0021182463|nr:uncharacterized protein LOC126252157 [Schistocerca nitens]
MTNDNTKLEKNDRHSKIRPYLDYFRNCFLELWFQAIHYGQPTCFGYEELCNTFRLGYLVRLEVYQESNGAQNKYKEDHGVGGGVVESLLEDDFGDTSSHYLFADNYFMSLKIVDKFAENGICISGSIKEQQNWKLPTKNCSCNEEESQILL